MITAVLLLGQAALGAAFRHGIIDVIPHVLGALVVAIFVAALAMSVLYRPEHEPLRPAGVTLLIITAAQVFIGLALFSMGLMDDIDPVAVIIATMVHAATAALTLAATLVAVVLIVRSVPAKAKSASMNTSVERSGYSTENVSRVSYICRPILSRTASTIVYFPSGWSLARFKLSTPG